MGLMPVNFRSQSFQGSLLDLFRECLVWMPKSEDIIFSQEMVELNSGRKTLRPIMQFGDYVNRRGSIINAKNENYLVVDEQMVAGLWNSAYEGQQFVYNFREMFEQKLLSMGAKVEVPPRIGQETLKYREGVDKTLMYRHGIKIANFVEVVPKNLVLMTEQDFYLLYLRTCSLLNCFPFPDSRYCEIKLRYVPSGVKLTKTEFSENEIIQKMARSAFLMNFSDEQKTYLEETEFFKQYPQQNLADWRTLAAEIRIEVSPRAQPLVEQASAPQGKTEENRVIVLKPKTPVEPVAQQPEPVKEKPPFVTEPMLIKFDLKDLMVYEQKMFYVDEKTMALLKKYDRKSLVIRVKDGSGLHPIGEYVIPNEVAVNFIEIVKGTAQWKKNSYFTSEVVPVMLSKYFTQKGMEKAG